VFSLFIICYLFFAGAGSGAYALAAVFSFYGRHTARDDLREYRTITRGGFWLGPLLVAFGAVFLIFDLGSPERAFTVFLTPKLTILSFGSWALVSFCLLAGISLLLHNAEQAAAQTVPKPLLRLIEVLTLLAALCVMAYTGVLVSSFPAVPFLHTPLVIVLFVLSSFSTGAAVITLYGFFNQQRKSMRYGLRIIPRIDLAFIVLEVVVLGAMLALKYVESSLARDSVYAMVMGEGFLGFWVGIVLLGILLPVGLGCVSRRSPRAISAATWAVSATAILVSGFALRYCLIIGGLHVATHFPA
jgi:formate-dependent nitrite reductase membrane component NrfD